MRRLAYLAALSLALVAFTGSTAAAAGPAGHHRHPKEQRLQVKPGVFVGTAEQCAPGPAGTPGGVSAAWVNHQGLPDAGRSDHALVLSKNVPTADCSSAYAVVRGVRGMPALTLGYDVRSDSYCGAGAARFNVMTSDGVSHFIGGCANGTPVPGPTDRRGVSWSTMAFDLTDPAVAYPPVAPGVALVSVAILHDEQGTSILDNIRVNDKVVGKPGRSHRHRHH